MGISSILMILTTVDGSKFTHILDFSDLIYTCLFDILICKPQKDLWLNLHKIESILTLQYSSNPVLITQWNMSTTKVNLEADKPSLISFFFSLHIGCIAKWK